MLREVVGIDPVVFATDYRYLRRDLAVSCRDHIEATPELTDGERTAVLGATATTLIPRLATPLNCGAPSSGGSGLIPSGW